MQRQETGIRDKYQKYMIKQRVNDWMGREIKWTEEIMKGLQKDGNILCK